MSGGPKTQLELCLETQLELGIEDHTGVEGLTEFEKFHLAEVLGWVYST